MALGVAMTLPNPASSKSSSHSNTGAGGWFRSILVLPKPASAVWPPGGRRSCSTSGNNPLRRSVVRDSLGLGQRCLSGSASPLL